MRAIDAELLKENAFSVFTQEYGMIDVVGVDAVDDAPTIEPQVAEGVWREERNPYGELVGWNHVECGRMTQEASKFCPNCGAKMRGVVRE